MNAERRREIIEKATWGDIGSLDAVEKAIDLTEQAVAEDIFKAIETDMENWSESVGAVSWWGKEEDWNELKKRFGVGVEKK